MVRLLFLVFISILMSQIKIQVALFFSYRKEPLIFKIRMWMCVKKYAMESDFITRS